LTKKHLNQFRMVAVGTVAITSAAGNQFLDFQEHKPASVVGVEHAVAVASAASFDSRSLAVALERRNVVTGRAAGVAVVGSFVLVAVVELEAVYSCLASAK
jgi:hypothetical protein